MHVEMLIYGHRIGGPCDQSVGKDIARNPFDGSVVGTVAEGGWSELSTCISAASDAFFEWSHSEISVRRTLLLRIAELVRERKHELAEIAVKEIGKPISFALAEVERTALTFELAAAELEKNSNEQLSFGFDTRSKGAKGIVRRKPIGPIFAIVPYNWPYNLTAHKIAPALATGNTMVLKPSSLGALCTMTLALLINEAGCPPGVLNCWNGPVSLVQKALSDPRIKQISFTGSAKVGWGIKEKNPRKSVTLELGGNAPAILTATADLDVAIPLLVKSAFGYSGQVCISTQNIYVHESIYAEAKQRLIDQTQATFSGNPADKDVVCGPLISADAVKKVVEFIEDARERGAKMLVSGEVVGNVLHPYLIEDAPSSSLIMSEEVFGPVVTLTSYQNLEDLVINLNQGRYGIHAAIFTNDSHDVETAENLEFSGVIVNDAPSTRFDNMPYGGLRESGVGLEGVSYAMEEMTYPQVTLLRDM